MSENGTFKKFTSTKQDNNFPTIYMEDDERNTKKKKKTQMDGQEKKNLVKYFFNPL